MEILPWFHPQPLNDLEEEHLNKMLKKKFTKEWKINFLWLMILI